MSLGNVPYAASADSMMFTAANLNRLYAEFDEKVSRALSRKTPLLAFEWAGGWPQGIWYLWTAGTPFRLHAEAGVVEGLDPNSPVRLNHDQAALAAELDKLDVVHVDTPGGRVFLDKWLLPGAPDPACDVTALHLSLEPLRRTVSGTEMDVHLGMDPPEVPPGDPQPYSHVRARWPVFGGDLPPARMHNHRVSVAEMAYEGVASQTLPRTWRRFDCYRFHNLNNSTLTLHLEGPPGSEPTVLTVPKYGVRTARRRADGTWATGLHVFWPYFRGDVPWLCLGVGGWHGHFRGRFSLALENSCAANNVGDPFLLHAWFEWLGGMLNPAQLKDERLVYAVPGPPVATYPPPNNPLTRLGDCVLTWGRCRISVTTPSGDSDLTVTVVNLAGWKAAVESAGITVSAHADGWTLSMPAGHAFAIEDIDTNLLAHHRGRIGASGGGEGFLLSLLYPRHFTHFPGRRALQWNEGITGILPEGMTPTADDIRVRLDDSMDVVRRKISVKCLWTRSLAEPASPKLGAFVLTPLGLCLEVNSGFDLSSGGVFWQGQLPVDPGWVFETDDLLYPYVAPQNWWASDSLQWVIGRCWWVLNDYRHFGAAMFSRSGARFPMLRGAFSPTSHGSVWSAYLPAGAPRGYGRLVWDGELARAWRLEYFAGALQGLGADYWIHKWGGPGGVDSTIRDPGNPDLTPQWTDGQIPGTDPGVSDDLFGDLLAPKRAECLEDLHGRTGTDEPPHLATMEPLALLALPDAQRARLPYTGLVEYYQRVPKSAWLWDLLVWHSNEWRRCHRRVRGESDVPVGPGFRLSDALVDGPGLSVTTETYPFYTGDLDGFLYLNGEGAAHLHALGAAVRREPGESGATSWSVGIRNEDLAGFIAARGFSCQLDWADYPPDYDPGTGLPRPGRVPVAVWGDFEVTESLTVEQPQPGGGTLPRSVQHRFVNLDL